jgi:hypothetical protein
MGASAVFFRPSRVRFTSGAKCGADRHDLVVAVKYPCWHVERLEIFREVRLGEGFVDPGATNKEMREPRIPYFTGGTGAVACTGGARRNNCTSGQSLAIRGTSSLPLDSSLRVCNTLPKKGLL